MIAATVVILWRLLAIVSLVVGVVGLVIPVLPTVPFLLVSAWAAGNGWPWLEERLLAHPTYGPVIKRWRARRAIPRMGKWWATIGMAGSAAGLAFLTAIPLGWVLGVAGTMLLIGVWIWSRPDA